MEYLRYFSLWRTRIYFSWAEPCGAKVACFSFPWVFLFLERTRQSLEIQSVIEEKKVQRKQDTSFAHNGRLSTWLKWRKLRRLLSSASPRRLWLLRKQYNLYPDQDLSTKQHFQDRGEGLSEFRPGQLGQFHRFQLERSPMQPLWIMSSHPHHGIRW